MDKKCPTCKGAGFLGAFGSSHESEPCGCHNGRIYSCSACLSGIEDTEVLERCEGLCHDCWTTITEAGGLYAQEEFYDTWREGGPVKVSRVSGVELTLEVQPCSFWPDDLPYGYAMARAFTDAKFQPVNLRNQ